MQSRTSHRGIYQSTSSKWWVIFWLLATIVVNAVVYLYLQSYHRVRDVHALVNAVHQPVYNERCRVHNATHFQCMPNILFIGASKCGTTSIMSYLMKHQNISHVNRRIHPDKHKEVHRFDRDTYNLAIKEIELADELASSPIVRHPDTSVIHYTPHYLYAPTVPFAVKEFYPYWNELKFIIILRDPIERALSSYWFKNSHLFHAGGDRGSLEEFQIMANSEIADRLNYEKCMASFPKDAKLDASYSLTHTNGISFIMRYLQIIMRKPVKYLLDPTNSLVDSVPIQTDKQSQHLLQLKRCFGASIQSKTLGLRHVDKSIYVDQLFRWYLNFPSTNFYILTLEEWEQDPVGQYTQLLKFINPNYYVSEEGKNELQKLLNTKVSLPYSLTHSYSLTLTHSLLLTHSLTHSLPHS